MRPGPIPLQVAFSVFYPLRFGQRCTISHPSSPRNRTSESYTSDSPNYETWTREELIARLKELTGSSIPQTSITTPSPSVPIAPTSTPAQPSSSPSPSPLPPPTSSKPEPKKPKPKHAKKPAREFDFSAYPTRKIALKFSYAGAGYCGLAWQSSASGGAGTPAPTPLPTVEGVLFAA